MRSTFHLRLLSALALLGGILTSGAAFRNRCRRAGPASFPRRTRYFLRLTLLTENSILSYVRASDGTISLSGSFLTGGNGGAGASSSAAPLGSQDGLALAGNNQDLIATNAGSDTISVFDVTGTTLKLVQQIGSGGQFPNSIAVHGDLVSVLNAGGAGSVQEFSLVKGRLATLATENRSLGLDNTTPPDYVHGAGQVGYTPNGQHLVVTTKTQRTPTTCSR